MVIQELQELERLAAAFYASDEDPTPSSNHALSLTQHALAFASELVRFCRQYPQIILALAEAKNNQYQKALPHAIRQLWWLAFIGEKLQFNDHYLQHLIAATMVLQTKTLQRTSSSTRSLILLWREKRLTVWLELYRIRKFFSMKPAALPLSDKRLTVSQRWPVIAYLLARTHTSPFLTRLEHIVRYTPARFHASLTPMLSFPGAVYGGCMASFNTQPVMVVGRFTDTSCVIVSNDQQQTEVPLNRLTVCAQTTDFRRWLQAYLNADIPLTMANILMPRTYPISRPPSSLVKITSLIHDKDANISDLSALVESEPVFADYLKTAATLDNRLQLSVKDVKQAVLTYGLERVGDLLVARALTERLQQKFYPLLSTATLLCELCMAISSDLATVADANISPQAAGLLSVFLIAPLFSLPPLKTLTRWPASSGSLFSINTFVQHSNDNLLTQACGLASQWGQTSQYIALLQHSADLPSPVAARWKKDAALLGLGLLLARQWLFSPRLDEASAEYKRLACQVLDVQQQDLELIQQRHAERLYRPLPD